MKRLFFVLSLLGVYSASCGDFDSIAINNNLSYLLALKKGSQMQVGKELYTVIDIKNKSDALVDNIRTLILRRNEPIIRHTLYKELLVEFGVGKSNAKFAVLFGTKFRTKWSLPAKLIGLTAFAAGGHYAAKHYLGSDYYKPLLNYFAGIQKTATECIGSLIGYASNSTAANGIQQASREALVTPY